jgi:(R,R)-butanediol dehydrogenase / meso-butanediol dehydrogenase / diacetyl reductase
MKALRWHARDDVRLDEIEPPGPPAAGEVQLVVRCCGICGTDVEEWREGPLMIPTTPHPLSGASAPLVLGHELAGEVVAVSDRRSESHPDGSDPVLRLGDLVAVDGLVSCGRCRQCQRGQFNLCVTFSQVGLMRDGGLQPLVNVPASACVVMPDNLDAEAGAVAETLSVGVRALRRGRLVPGDQVAVVGGGAVGLLAAQAARALGASSVTVVEPLADRRALATSLGVDQVVDPGQVGGDSGELSADVVLECSGRGSAVPAAVAAAGPAGRVVLVGIGRSRPPLDVWDVVRHEKELIGSFSHLRQSDFKEALMMLASDDISYRSLLTKVPLSRSLDRGLLALAGQPEEYVKIVVVPDAA